MKKHLTLPLLALLSLTAHAGELELITSWSVEGEPGAITVQPKKGEVLVSINNNYRVVRYSASGEVLGNFGREGEMPVAVAVDAAGNATVAVNITNNHRIVRYNREGEVQAEWDAGGTVAGLALDEKGNSVVAVSVNNNHRVVHFSRSGEVLARFQGEGAPVAMAVDAAGNATVAVSINNNHRTVRYSREGEPQAVTEVAGKIESKGLAGDGEGGSVMSITNVLRQYNRDGTLVAEWTHPNLKRPGALARTGNRLVVADRSKKQINVFGFSR